MFAALFSSPQGAIAETGLVDLLPAAPRGRVFGAAPTSAQSGLMLTLDTRWACNYGYRPMRFKFEALAPDTADRKIDVSLFTSHRVYGASRLSVSGSVELPSGAGEATLTLPVPQYASQQMLAWDVRIDGVLDPELSRAEIEAINHPPNTEGAIHVLRAADGGNSRPRPQFRIGPFRNQPSTGGQIETTIRRLPEQWIDYSGLDFVELTAEELVKLSVNRPEAVDALRRWVGSGGALWIDKAGDEFERLPQVSRILGLRAPPPPEPEPEPDPEPDDDAEADDAGAGDDEEKTTDEPTGPLEKAPEWRWVEMRLREQETAAVEVTDQVVIRIGQEDAEAEVANGQPNSARGGRGRGRRGGGVVDGITSEDWFAEARLGFGVVVAFKESWVATFADMRPGLRGRPSIERIAFMRHSFDRSWVERHGMAPDAANPDFSNLLPPGAGLAPITEFRILITLFVLVAGPLNLWLLRRHQRTQLMVLTVPLTAAALTFALIAYAVLGEGFGVRVRARSFATLDQNRGELIAWSRHCYYAGFAPSEGLEFPADTALYPVLPGWKESMAEAAAGRDRAIDWRGDRLRMTRGWLPAREPTQFVALHASGSSARIDFRRESDRLAATNRLGKDALLLVVIDDSGEFWIAEDLREYKLTPLTPTDRNEAVAKLRTVVADNRPTAPLGLEAAEDNVFVEEQRRQARRRLRRDLGIQYSSGRLSDNLLNDELNRLVGIDGSRPLNLPLRTYVAVSDETGWIPLGLEGVRESESFHVLVGHW